MPFSERLKVYEASDFEKIGEHGLVGCGSCGEVWKWNHKELKEVAIKQFSTTGSITQVQKKKEK